MRTRYGLILFKSVYRRDARVNRRLFLAHAIALLTSPAVNAATNSNAFWEAPRHLHLRRQVKPGVWEEASGVYFANGKVNEPVYEQLCRILRDVNTGKAVRMSVDLLDILAGIAGWFLAHGIAIQMNVLSGFREVKTNEDAGGKKDSAHLRGGACDFYIPGISVYYLQKVALYLEGGGVGIYPDHKQNFLHVDDGRIRVWKGEG